MHSFQVTGWRKRSSTANMTLYTAMHTRIDMPLTTMCNSIVKQPLGTVRVLVWTCGEL